MDMWSNFDILTRHRLIASAQLPMSLSFTTIHRLFRSRRPRRFYDRSFAIDSSKNVLRVKPLRFSESHEILHLKLFM
ncbi:hypothetical protein Plhal304r1_c005g0022611 [Plasmopara halstedii]